MSALYTFSLECEFNQRTNHTKGWIMKVKHPSLDIYRKIYISLVKMNNITLLLRIRIILLSTFMIYFYCIYHSGSFLIVFLDTFDF